MIRPKIKRNRVIFDLHSFRVPLPEIAVHSIVKKLSGGESISEKRVHEILEYPGRAGFASYTAHSSNIRHKADRNKFLFPIVLELHNTGLSPEDIAKEAEERVLWLRCTHKEVESIIRRGKKLGVIPGEKNP